jgi:hypothetical protein
MEARAGMEPAESRGRRFERSLGGSGLGVDLS